MAGAGRYGAPPPGGRPFQFFGKNLDPCDYQSCMVTYLKNRLYQRDFRDKKVLQPHSSYRMHVVPPVGDHSAVDSMCVYMHRQVTNRVNKCPILSAIWTPDARIEGRYLVTGTQLGEFTLWKDHTFKFEWYFTAMDGQAVQVLTGSRDEEYLVAGDASGAIKFFSFCMSPHGDKYEVHDKAVNGISFAPTDSKLVTCSEDSLIKIWDHVGVHRNRTPESILTLDGTGKGDGHPVHCIDWHPHKALIASGHTEVRLWDPLSGKHLHTLKEHMENVNCLQWHRNGNWLLAGSRDRSIQLYDIRRMKATKVFKSTASSKMGSVTAVAWHPIHDELFASTDYDGNLFYWLAGHSDPQAEVRNAHQRRIRALAWHPVGHLLVTGGWDHRTRFWGRPQPGDTPDKMDEHMMFNFTANRQDQGPDAASSSNTSHVTPGQTQRKRKPYHTYVCDICQAQGEHYKMDCPQRDAKAKQRPRNKVPPEGYVCNKCKIPGHWIQDCTNKAVPPDGYICHKCKKPGHFITDCPLVACPPVDSSKRSFAVMSAASPITNAPRPAPSSSSWQTRPRPLTPQDDRAKPQRRPTGTDNSGYRPLAPPHRQPPPRGYEYGRPPPATGWGAPRGGREDYGRPPVPDQYGRGGWSGGPGMMQRPQQPPRRRARNQIYRY